jgi:rhamnulokinase
VIEVDAFEFIAPVRMPERIDAAVAAQGREQLATRDQLVRGIVASLARAHGVTIAQAATLSAQAVEVGHLVGGGAQNALLCLLTADVTRLPVGAGRVEATALGNVMIQARTHGALAGSLEDLRAGMADGQATRRYEVAQWTEVA